MIGTAVHAGNGGCWGDEATSKAIEMELEGGMFQHAALGTTTTDRGFARGGSEGSWVRKDAEVRYPQGRTREGSGW
ncbi:MAG: hypothetical protein NZ898_01565 [Myxococcota bacterium]|nr:hypothetical protein [Myxococcota bacterium]